MRIEIDVSATNEPNSHGPLDRILHKIEDGWHVWDTAREPDIDAIRASTWVRDKGRQGMRVREMLDAREYTGALASLAGLRDDVDHFFDTVKVMDDDEALRGNRLALLARIGALFMETADISLLQPTG